MNVNQINNLMNMVGMIQNPQSALQQIMSKNPNASAIINQMNQQGLTPAQYLQQYAKQNNINLAPIQNMLNKHGVKF